MVYPGRYWCLHEGVSRQTGFRIILRKKQFCDVTKLPYIMIMLGEFMNVPLSNVWEIMNVPLSNVLGEFMNVPLSNIWEIMNVPLSNVLGEFMNVPLSNVGEFMNVPLSNVLGEIMNVTLSNVGEFMIVPLSNVLGEIIVVLFLMLYLLNHQRGEGGCVHVLLCSDSRICKSVYKRAYMYSNVPCLCSFKRNLNSHHNN